MIRTVAKFEIFPTSNGHFEFKYLESRTLRGGGVGTFFKRKLIGVMFRDPFHMFGAPLRAPAMFGMNTHC